MSLNISAAPRFSGASSRSKPQNPTRPTWQQLSSASYQKPLLVNHGGKFLNVVSAWEKDNGYLVWLQDVGALPGIVTEIKRSKEDDILSLFSVAQGSKQP
ncbi:MAG: hypothetical protein VKK59_06095 [Vampirovibrionales bacterium]|nr:hypothetical protein [Vampirovibrionales bacterium]